MRKTNKTSGAEVKKDKSLDKDNEHKINSETIDELEKTIRIHY